MASEQPPPPDSNQPQVSGRAQYKPPRRGTGDGEGSTHAAHKQPPPQAGQKPPTPTREGSSQHQASGTLSENTCTLTNTRVQRVSTIPKEYWSESAVRPGNDQPRLTTWCLTACCILFWLLVIAVGLAVLVIYILYSPQPPRFRVATATLNAGYIDELNGGGLVLNSDLTVLATISNPNTKIDVVLHYMELDLFFEGNLIATQAVWPAPLHEKPLQSVLRSVHLVVSEVTLTKEDVAIWQNATAKGGPVPLELAGRFRTQLNFGRWLRYNYWVYPSCRLRLDPPPSGALRFARC